MAEKMSMLIVKVDLDCHKCYDKMRKILCKLQDHEGIRMISFDDKSKTIAIAGPFDPQRLACKIRCRGGKTVKDVQIVDVPGGNDKPPDIVDASPDQSPVNKNVGKKQPSPPCAKAREPFPEEYVIPPPPVRPCGCGCGGARMYACSAAGPPYGYRGCRIIIEEEDPNAACDRCAVPCSCSWTSALELCTAAATICFSCFFQ